ncbi:MAG: phosphoglucosamine mutase [Prolixibacteraceae bacterium]|nr:phosphoglucosamine mutase [Prolixibacteraceae bacterium]
MTLIKSISGIRGTIGGQPGEGLSPLDIVKFTSSYAKFIKTKTDRKTIVVGRDARISGEMVNHIVCGTLMAMGFDVLNIGLATTPTTEMAVMQSKSAGGIILTASHNPKQWNALKLLNDKGEFLSAAEGEQILELAEKEDFSFTEVDQIGQMQFDESYLQKHIDAVLALKLVDKKAIEAADFSVVIDCVNSVGGMVLPALLAQLGVKVVHKLYCEPNGQFPHNPEPLPEHLTEIARVIREVKGDVGFVVDPDVDRLAIVCENGEMFGEEYTLVSIADYVLSQTPGHTVSNLSSTRALRDVTKKHGQEYFASAVGEVNVVEKMKATNAVIGGEGNGGVIYPEIHYGRDALVGIALFLTHLAKSKQKVSELRAAYPPYSMTKHKIELSTAVNMTSLLNEVAAAFAGFEVKTIDGVKIDFPDKWVHLRKSNTEPIIRIYAEAPTDDQALQLANGIRAFIEKLIEIK